MQRLVWLVLVGVLLLASAPAASADSVPPSITTAVRLENVVCRGPVCCGWASVVRNGHWYSLPTDYCRWFKVLHTGDVVTTKLWLDR